jgi:hypothetical protein
MRRQPNRSIEIFSMSVLDMFASALGAFILITIILFPDYSKKMQLEHQVDELQKTVAQQQQQITQQQRQITQQTAEIQRDRQQIQQQQETIRRQQAELAKTFLIVTIDWPEAGENDVDLHVTDARGREFYFSRNNRNRTDFPGSEAQLSYDATHGPGLELWQLPVADAGTYKVELVLYSKDSTTQSVTVNGNIFVRQGRTQLPAKTMTQANERVSVATVTIASDGAVQIR